ncbi:DUF4123 domain-containing protein [Morganella morganii]|uniref:DUF4123 domain-containing protein n=3 Tax=Morganella morganii TaxID=582 RepID=UPI00062C3F4F|nr:DUF4123 domain-containing protein [Morganella morganii]BEP22961.1 DUF4123 domain-containing protein [Morganella morganii subsp. sibonii]HDS6843150.1 DUF4123 domain-containing protein [Morganella morganii subsp. morganii]EKU5843332.1 DUF4123 domain-containing protein [Morganella morganii]ELB1545118.1 DUF4123 domain-containing protein [Morganella morganii]WNP30902.1 DUF4123 domain-containing protein [Morganella morganii]
MTDPEICYAVIDAASEPDVFSLLDEYNPPACCLYSEPLQPEMADLAPYLVEVSDDVRKWLDTRQTPWGIYLYSAVAMRELRHHLRKFTMVIIPGQEKPVFWRFYDPRNIREILATFDDWRLHTFLGPVTKLETSLWGHKKSDRFEKQRKRYPEQAAMRGMFMKFSAADYAKINTVFEQRLAKKMAVYFLMYEANSDNSGVTLSVTEIMSRTLTNDRFGYEALPAGLSPSGLERYLALSQDIIAFFNGLSVSEEESYLYFCYALAFFRIKRFSDIPPEWLSFLSGSEGDGNYRICKLLISLFDALPDIYHSS